MLQENPHTNFSVKNTHPFKVTFKLNKHHSAFYFLIRLEAVESKPRIPSVKKKKEILKYWAAHFHFLMVTVEDQCWIRNTSDFCKAYYS